jgi:hypothetical protein
VAADAVSLLQHDERAKTIKQRLHGYVDDSVSADVMLGAQNYLEVIFANNWKSFIFSAFWLSAIVVVSIFVLPFCGLPVYRSVISETKLRSVTSYGVQISFDRREWTDVDCAESGGHCVFDCSILGVHPHHVVINRFPKKESARFVRVLPQTWLEMDDEIFGADLRLGIMGSLDDGPESLDFKRVGHNDAVDVGQAWVQNGCNKEYPSEAAGMWSSKEEVVGSVQCCIRSPSIYVCTRDGCLSGRGNDSIKVSWHEAEKRCESRGWRLCSREELNRKSSSGCCPSDWVSPGVDSCGYDDSLVWTSTTSDEGPQMELGRLNGETAFENVKNITIDLLREKDIFGIKIQGPVPEIPFHGPLCFFWIWGMPIEFGVATCMIVGTIGLARPYTSHMVFRGVWTWVIIVSISAIIVGLTDSSAPSVSSGNAICKSKGPSIYVGLSIMIIQFAIFLDWWIVDFFCPEKFILFAEPALGVGMGTSFILLINTSDLIWLCILVCSGTLFIIWMPCINIPMNRSWKKKAQQTARSKLEGDVKRYDAAWAVAKNVPEADGFLDRIKMLCSEAKGKLSEERANIVAKWSW